MLRCFPNTLFHCIGLRLHARRLDMEIFFQLTTLNFSGPWSSSSLVSLISLISFLISLHSLWRFPRQMLTTRNECNKSSSLIKNSTLALNLLTSSKIISKISIPKVKSNITKRCLTYLRFFQVLWKHSWPSSCMRMRLEFIGSCKTEMTTFILSILKNSRLKGTAREKRLQKQVINQSLCVSLWMESFTTLQLTDTLKEGKWSTMTSLLTRLKFFTTTWLGLMFLFSSMIVLLLHKFLISSQTFKKTYKKLSKTKKTTKKMKTSSVPLLSAINYEGTSSTTTMTSSSQNPKITAKWTKVLL